MSNKTTKPAVQWTPAQKLGIETTGASLLVSAAAGSGKTAVLAERCAYLVCDATPTCDVDQLLVVTFTEAAAAEMKSRIAAALGKRLDKEPHNTRLQTQLSQIDRAQVSTLHGFCARLLRQHFYLIGLDPSFSIFDGDEAKLLRGEVARELFQDRYEATPAETDIASASQTEAFLKFIDDYGEGNDDGLRSQVISTHELLASLIDPQAWIEAARAKLEGGSTGSLNSSPLGIELKVIVKRILDRLVDKAAASVATLNTMARFEAYAKYVLQLQGELTDWQVMFGEGNFDALAKAAVGYSPPRLPTVRNGTPGKEVAVNAVDSVRSGMSAKSELAGLLRFSAAEWIEGLRSIQPAADVFLDLVTDFGVRYSDAKQRARSLDFNDLERFTLRVLRDPQSGPTDVARLYHRQLHHVLVDEYQDINEIQDEILRLVSRECVCETPTEPTSAPPNLFCVGDVKQSIYGFRLAEPARFLARARDFRAATSELKRVIDLQQNFRSRAPLLESINALFTRLMTREAADIDYDQSHELRPGAIYPPATSNTGFSGAPVELHLLPLVGSGPDGDEPGDDDGSEASAVDGSLDRTEREATFIAHRIEELMGHRGQPATEVFDKDLGAYRPLKYRDVVILLRSMKFKAEQVADILQQHKVPVHRASGTGYFGSLEMRDMLSLLALLDNAQQDIPLAAILRSPFASLPHAEDALARIRLAYPSGEQPIAFHKSATRYASEQHDDLSGQLELFFGRLNQWRTLARQRPLADLIWTIYEQSGYLTYCSGLPNGEQRCANLLDLHERSRQFGGFARQGLYRFLSFMDDLREETDLGQPSVLGEAQDVVRVMSVHKSKGLEFPVVFLTDLGKRINMKSAQEPILVDRALHLGLKVVDEVKQIRYPSLAHVLVQRRLKQQMIAEELRVLYVAMTRAKEHLILVGTCTQKKADGWDSLWEAHATALPADTVLDASTPLDWIGPATTAMRRQLPGMYLRTMHGEVEIARWSLASTAAAKPSRRLESVLQLAPLNPAPPPHPMAQAIIDRVGFRYPLDEFTHLRASVSVTEWTKRHQHESEPPEVAEVSKTSAVASPVQLALPAFLSTGSSSPAAISAADIGTATHLVLQHLDFHRPCRDTDLADQIQKMFDRDLITTEQASVVDRQSIEWFAGSDIGTMLATAEPHDVLREVPFNYAVAPEQFGAPPSSNPLDQVMLRGRIDLLVQQPDGFHVIDYKTDRVRGKELEARRDYYAGQVRIYRDAIFRFTGLAVVAIHLVFLTPRVICQV